ncbi:MAG: T9SS type A sorting domain-containing protein [Altibacter sp.]|uniref:T9SS type A sorting domain-containing protein n=1 Tax=Altibacter sp. TaxID=2024823 RepID=UPI001D306838|nr:T9SS type A sorting domain-containing protein [Altibacter sp.]MBZ0327577.1 T9SS type A sorting domain-containing protein [Altibacter sp.]
MERRYTILLLLLFVFSANAQIVDIPDPNFKNALVHFEVVDTTGNGLGDSVADTNGDGEIQLSEAEAVIGLIVSYYSITSLEGIQSFTNLEVLKSRGNFVETVDLSQNVQLEWLHLSTNPLISIDVSHNTNLKRLFVYNNELTTLDVSQNVNLESLRCYTNNLTELNIANGNNTTLDNFLAYENPELTCIQVDDEDFANAQPDWIKDDSAVYSEDCTLGVADIENEFQLTLFPNPVTQVLFIDSPLQIHGAILILDVQGHVIRHIAASNTIDVSALHSGIYFLKIASERQTVVKKFIKK